MATPMATKTNVTTVLTRHEAIFLATKTPIIISAKIARYIAINRDSHSFYLNR